MPSYTINSITWTSLPTANQTTTVRHKIQGAPDSSYVIDSNNVQVLPSGSLVTPFTITGLAFATSYTIQQFNNCGGEGTTINITTDADPCPDITGITGSASNG